MYNYLLIDSVTKIDNIGLLQIFHHNGHFLKLFVCVLH